MPANHCLRSLLSRRLYSLPRPPPVRLPNWLALQKGPPAVPNSSKQFQTVPIGTCQNSNRHSRLKALILRANDRFIGTRTWRKKMSYPKYCLHANRPCGSHLAPRSWRCFGRELAVFWQGVGRVWQGLAGHLQTPHSTRLHALQKLPSKNRTRPDQTPRFSCQPLPTPANFECSKT